MNPLATLTAPTSIGSLLAMGTVLGDSNQLFRAWIQALDNVAPCAA
jgi:hypothetical protein